MERRKESQQGKVKYHNETDVIRKTREIQKSKRRAVQLLRAAGPIRHKENKNRYKFHFVLYPPRNSVTSPTRGPFPSAVAFLFVRRRFKL